MSTESFGGYVYVRGKVYMVQSVPNLWVFSGVDCFLSFQREGREWTL
jgi:hypothetical protein